MTTVDKKTLHAWLHHCRDEADAASLDGVLAGVERRQANHDVFLKLQAIERRHTELWAKLLAEHGHPVPSDAAKPSLNARFMAWLGRRFGPRYLLPLLLREEGREVKGYMELHRQSSTDDARSVSLTLARESAAHAETLANLAGRASAMEKEGIRLMPEVEEEELALVYQTKGVEAGIARQMAAEVMRDSQRALDEQVREELKIGEAHATPFKEGWLTGVATAVGAFIPVAPFLLFSGRTAAWIAFTIA